MMTWNPCVLPFLKSRQLLKSVWEISWDWCWPESISMSRTWLRRFLLLKLVTVLLFPHGTWLPPLVGCVFSLRAALLLRSPRISTKPSVVFLGQLALCDALVPLQWALRLGAALDSWTEEARVGPVGSGERLWWREAAGLLCQQLRDAHHLASLLLLGLLGAEATLVSRWPQQTQTLRTSHWALFGCGLVWLLVLSELVMSLPSPTPDLQMGSLAPRGSRTSHASFMLPSSLPAFPPCLRRTLWLMNLWLHSVFFCRKPQRRKSSFH